MWTLRTTFRCKSSVYVDGKLTAGERRVLTTKWVGEACKKQIHLIKHSFKKWVSSNCLDGSEDALIDIKGIEGYMMSLPEKMIMNSKSRVQSRTWTRGSIVYVCIHVMYISLYIHDIWKRKTSYLTQSLYYCVSFWVRD